MKKIGIITFHNSYNCGSMLETFAIQECSKMYGPTEIINYSSDGQKELYSVFLKNNSIKKIIKNILILPHYKKILLNNKKYKEFQKKNFILSEDVNEETIEDSTYNAIIAGSDQIWNVTIEDFNDVYFLNWVKKARKIAYSPSFGAKNPNVYYQDKNKLKKMINGFDALSIREENGKRWLKELTGKEVPVLLDPTLLLEKEDYERIEDNYFNPKYKYIFFYSPSFNKDICKFVKEISDKYGLKVITWSTKPYYFKFIKRFGFILPPYESPAVYLHLIKNAEMILTTSYHGTIFSTIYNKNFFTIKNGGMFQEDDRVLTLLKQINMMDRLIEYNFKDEFNYLEDVDYKNYKLVLNNLKKESKKYLKEYLEDLDEK